MSSFNVNDFLPKRNQHNISSNQSVRSTHSRLSFRGSSLASKKFNTTLNQTQALIEEQPRPGPSNSKSTSGPFAPPNKLPKRTSDQNKASKASLAARLSPSHSTKENDVGPLPRSQSPRAIPSQVPRSPKIVKPIQKPPRVSFAIHEEEDGMEIFKESKTPQKAAQAQPEKVAKKGKSPAKRKGPSPAKRGGPSPAKSAKSSDLEFDSSKGFCPICQVPLGCIKITKYSHTLVCKVDQDAPECDAGLECEETNGWHYRENSHKTLAESRAKGDSDVEICPTEPPRRMSANVVQKLFDTIPEDAEEESVHAPQEKSVDKTKESDNPFLSNSSDEEGEEDIFKEFEGNDNTNAELDALEAGVASALVEDETVGADKELDKCAPCVEGACDQDRVSVSIAVNGENIKFCATDNEGWNVSKPSTSNLNVSHTSCKCQKSLKVTIQDKKTELESAKNQWGPLMSRMRRPSTSSISSVSSAASSLPSFDGRKCPQYKLIRGTSFAVDAFSYGKIPNVRFHFLSHFHYDHYIGLTKHFTGIIYCSEITGRLVQQHFSLKDSQIRNLPLDEPIMVDRVKVTAMDANHCPGSLMLLFQLLDGTNVVHTGDFRFSPTMESYSAFWNLNIDVLHLDTTYCNAKYDFPSQDEILSLVGTLADDGHSEFGDKCLFVCGSYTIGKERVFVEISKKLNLKFWADSAGKRRCLKNLQDEDINKYMVDSPEQAQMHILPLAKISLKFLEAYFKKVNRGSTRFTKIIAFRPSGWQHNENSESFHHTQEVRNISIHSVPYSEHSSFSELRRFVKFLKPRIVIPTVSSKGCTWRQMSEQCKKWLQEK